MIWTNFQRPPDNKILDVTYVKIRNSNSKILPIWIHECKNLKKIKLVNCGIERIIPNTFPQTVTSINLVDNNLKTVPKLPDNVKLLNISRNHITDLNDVLPDGLEILIYSCNNATSLPHTLPSSLKKLTCSFNNIEKIETELPKSLKYFNFANNDIYVISNELDEFMMRDDVKFEYFINPIQKEVYEAYIEY